MKKSNKLSKGERRPAKNLQAKRSIGEKLKANKDAKMRRRAEHLAKLPKNPFVRFLYYINPKHFAEYWFNRDGLFRFLKIMGVTFAILLILTMGVFAYFRKDLPRNITDLKTCTDGASTLYYDRTGQTLLWSSSGDVECYPIPQDQMPKNIQNAVIAIEDKDFYNHGGFSFAGIMRSAVNNAKGGSTQGGSTITQQFVKNSLLTQDRNVIRKLKELILATELERSYSKDEILTAYLNEISFGSRYAGIEAASKGYFNKPAKDLSLDQAATLAAMIQAPTYFSPYGENTQELIDRRNYVLKLMQEQGYASEEEVANAKKAETLTSLVQTKPGKYKDIIAPYFVTEVQKQLEEEYGATNARKAGFKVTTTLDLALQKKAEEVIATGVTKLERIGGDNMAGVAEDVATGQVLALVGGRGWDYPGFGEVNYATTPRSPGSSFKPYDYATLMTQNKNWGAGSTLYDLQTDLGAGWKPLNWDKKYYGAVSMRTALGQSRNIPAIKAMYMAGIKNTQDMAKKMGLKSGITGCYTSGKEDCDEILSTAIGDGGQIKLSEHVHGFSTFARMGVYKPQTYILKIQDIRGKTINEYKETPGEPVLDPQIAYSINDMLSDTRASILGTQYRIKGTTSAFKTGTTNNNENGWLVGYTSDVVFGIWSGHHENKQMTQYTNSVLGPAWNGFLTEAAKGRPNKGWAKPASMKTVCMNLTTGYATTSGGKCDIFPSWYTPRYPNNDKRATIDSVSGKLATECTPERAKQAVVGGGIASELPSSDPLYRNWIAPVTARYGQTGGAIPTDKDDIHSCDPAEKPAVEITTATKNPDGTYTISATVTKGKYDLKTLSFTIDGVVPPGASFDVTNTQTVSFKYTPTASTSTLVTANVVDSVLYDATTSKELSFVVP
ncbi:transglycosylase domain-containing protein [Candidatus Nomurabacteria bacterium]|nr:transglycosylase domain-containing protein [Candidatus Saccharibacteria bacterium]MCB9839879.1 transglycosylase domain-containing protein [Candidatus Nomurabacteria bacterium]